MERLAAQGMKFTQAYASAVCSPTRVSALTGMNAARHRVTNWTLRKDRSPDNAQQDAPAAGVEPERHLHQRRHRADDAGHAAARAAAHRRLSHDPRRQGALRREGHAGRESAEPRLRREHRRPLRRAGRAAIGARRTSAPRGAPSRRITSGTCPGLEAYHGTEHLPDRGAHAGGDQGRRESGRGPATVLPLHGALRRPRAVGEGRPVLSEVSWTPA